MIIVVLELVYTVAIWMDTRYGIHAGVLNNMKIKCEDCESVFEDNEEDDAEGIRWIVCPKCYKVE